MLHKILFMHSNIIVKDNIVQFDNLQRLNKLYNNSKYIIVPQSQQEILNGK